jgi:hypothetical protein
MIHDARAPSTSISIPLGKQGGAKQPLTLTGCSRAGDATARSRTQLEVGLLGRRFWRIIGADHFYIPYPRGSRSLLTPTDLSSQ